MPKPRSASDLYHRVAFDLRQEVDRGDGVTVGAFVEQFQRRACYIDKHGGEAVMASRLQGKHTQVIFVRACSQTRLVTAEWQIRDARTGVTYNIRDITHTQDRMWVDFLCETGVATG